MRLLHLPGRLRMAEWQLGAVMWLVSIAVAAALAGMGHRLAADLPRLDADLNVEQFADQDALASSREEVKALNATLKDLTDQRDPASLAAQAASGAFDTARAAFDDWLAEHKPSANGSPGADTVSRSRQLEQLKARERQAEAALEDIDEQLRTARRGLLRQREAQAAVMHAAEAAWKSASWRQEIRVFVARLALTLPLCVVAGWLLHTRRGSEHWPLLRGFVMFAAVCFATELLPYVPTYGGYVPYAAGMLFTLVAGHWLLKYSRARLAAHAKVERQLLEQQRRAQHYETALRKLAHKTCPGCEGSLLTTGDASCNFCVHCGMTLYVRCPTCETRRNAFFKFCPSCGSGSEARRDTQALPLFAS